ncbi:MAG: GNAT family N-acetyltransferase, partial [Chloroflexales bacterium]|nr:GNAT family N-acetyltransferase [Chloroflexales bacterium]
MNDLTYRPLSEADRPLFATNDAHAFVMDLVDVEYWLANNLVGDLRGLYTGGQLVAQLVIIPFTVMTGGVDLPLGGIAGVATPPEHRRRGYVEQMLLAACREMRERGMALCMLHPFKASFYRQFGWGTCQERRLYSGSPELFRGFLKQQRGQFVPAGEGDIAELNAIYTGALRGRFGPLVRDEAWWKKDVLVYNKKPRYAYIWRDESGRGRSYVVYRWDKRADGLAMSIREIVALDPEARTQLFAFLANHDSQCSQVRFLAPADAPVNLLLPNPLKCEVEPYFMLRLLDVAKALADYRYPREANGTLSLAVRDSWLAENQGVYRIEVADGAAQVTRLADTAEADITCDVAVLAQLYSRYARPRTAAAFGLLEAPDRAALALLEAM